MIEGDFSDISLPSVLQLLCLEAGKTFRLGLMHDIQRGEIYVRRGWVIAANFGILEGEDAFCEFMSWQTGSFWAETLKEEVELFKNLSFAFQPTPEFMQDCEYLHKHNVGLNSEITGSILFGSTAWKELVKDHPLDREMLSVLAWLREGRTMHQAMREYGFDVMRAVHILVRLLITKTVDVIRPALRDEEQQLPEEGFVDARMITTGGQEAAAAKLAQAAAKALESAASVAQEAFLSTSFKSMAASDTAARPSDIVADLPRAQSAINSDTQSRTSMEARLRAKRSGVSSGSNIPAYNSGSQIPAHKEDAAANLTSAAKEESEVSPISTSVPSQAVKDTLPPAGSSGLQALLKSALERSRQIAAQRLPGVNDGAGQSLNKDIVQWTPASDLLAKAEDGNVSNSEAPGDSPDSSLIAPEPSQSPTELKLQALFEQGKTRETQEPEEPVLDESGVVDDLLTSLTRDSAMPDLSQSVSENVPADDPRFTQRTQAMPLVAMDIERLLRASFSPTQFGRLALSNPSLDPYRRQTLLDCEQGKQLSVSLNEGLRSAAAVLSSYRYCLDRGYIESSDPVIPLTADLLLGRMEIDQYLLQRRRLTGDQLRDLIKVAREEGIKLPQLLVRSGFLTEGDIETLSREQKRFAFK